MSKIRPLMVCSALSLTLLHATPARAADAGCQPTTDAMKKYAAVPSHLYITTIAQYNGGKPESSEMITVGGVTYVGSDGKWIRSKFTPQDVMNDQKDQEEQVKDTCRYLHDESVNGEAAAVYSVHSESPDDHINHQIWISKSKGLPLKQETDIDVGGAMGKSHKSLRYEYNNVHPPNP
jgi:hypothetical protein